MDELPGREQPADPRTVTTMKVRTLIADDEDLARERLHQLLTERSDIELVGECADGRQAVAAIQEHSPELIFLDIQMPELDGFAVLEAIDLEVMPVIVFVTAHDKFALKAFEVHAVDYLLKPFDRERFESALNRALEQVKHRADPARSQAQASVLAEVQAAAKPVERLAVKSGGRITIVKVADIAWVEAAHNYVEIHEDKQCHLLRETISAIEQKLPPDKFVRISRSVIVNVEKIKELQPLFYGEYTVTLHSGKNLTLSRRYRGKLPQLGVG
jgi:two-component system, LytTR family, response regulator